VKQNNKWHQVGLLYFSTILLLRLIIVIILYYSCHHLCHRNPTLLLKRPLVPFTKFRLKCHIDNIKETFFSIQVLWTLITILDTSLNQTPVDAASLNLISWPCSPVVYNTLARATLFFACLSFQLCCVFATVASLRRKSAGRKKLFLPACKNESYLSKDMMNRSEFMKFLKIFYLIAFTFLRKKLLKI